MSIVRKSLCLIIIFILSISSLILSQNLEYSYAASNKSSEILKAEYFCNTELLSAYSGKTGFGTLPYQVYMREMEDTTGFVPGFASWKTASLVDGENKFSYKGYYEAILFDLFMNVERDESYDEGIDSVVKATKAKNFKTMKSAYEKVFGKTGTDLNEYVKLDFTDEDLNDIKFALFEEGGTYYQTAFGSFENFNKVLSGAKTILDMNHRISCLLAVDEISRHKITVLDNMIGQCGKEDGEDYDELIHAIRKIKGYYTSDFSTSYLISCEINNWAEDKVVEICAEKIWDDMMKDLGNGWVKLFYQAGKSALNEWFGVDKQYECYMQMYALGSIYGILSPVTIEARENFEKDPTERNAAILNECIELNCGYEGLAYEYSIDYLDVFDESGYTTVMNALGYQGTDGTVMKNEYRNMQALKDRYFQSAEQMLSELAMQGYENYDVLYSDYYYVLENQEEFDAFCTVSNDVASVFPDRKTNLGISCNSVAATQPSVLGRGKFGTLSIENCQLSFNCGVSTGWLLLSDGKLVTGGDFTVSSIRKMNSDNDLIHVKGDFNVNGDNGGQGMKAGRIELEGDLVFDTNSNGHGSGFHPTETCRTVFCGSELQTIRGNMHEGCDIGLIEIRNPLFTMDMRYYPTDGFYYPNLVLAEDSCDITYSGVIQARTLNLNGHKLSTAGDITVSSTFTSKGNGGSLKAKTVKAESIELTDSSVAVDADVTGSNLKLTGSSFFVGGDCALNGITISEGQFTVGGDFSTDCIRNMNSENDILHVAGDMTVNGQITYASRMEAGAVELEGDLIFNAVSDNKRNGYNPTGTCKTVFCGEKLQTVRGKLYDHASNIGLIEIQNPLFTMDMEYNDYSHILYPTLSFVSDCNITYEDGKIQASSIDLNGHKVITESAVTVKGNLTSTVTDVDKGELKAKTIEATNIALTDSSLNADADVSSKYVSLDNAQLTVGGDFSTDCIRNMNSENDILHVAGDMTVNGQITYASRMKAGTVELEGDLILNTGRDNTRYGYDPSGTCKTVFCGENKQNVNRPVNIVINAHSDENDLSYVSGQKVQYIYDPDYQTGDRYIQLTSITADAEKYTFDKNGLNPALVVKYGELDLSYGNDYTSRLDDRTETLVTVTITGKGKYKGEKSITLNNLEVNCTEHDLIEHPYQAKTCTEDGNKPYWSCSVCGGFFADSVGLVNIDKDSWVLQAGHEYGELIRKKSPTCKEDGFDVYYECSVCHGLFDADKNAATKESLTIKSLGHDYQVVPGTAKEATCTEAGKVADQKCSRCDSVIEGAVIPALSHDWGEWEVATPSTCIRAGQLKRVCKRNPEHVEYKDTDLIAHDLIHMEPKAATCTKAGNKEYWTCNTCGKYFFNEGKTEESSADTVIPATGHDYQIISGTEKAATCLEEGKAADQKCSRCGDVKIGDKIARLQHLLKEVSLKKATDKEAGVIRHWICGSCSRCFADEKGTKEIDKNDTVIAKNNYSVKVKKKQYTAKSSKKTTFKASALYTVKNRKGKVTYKKGSGDKKFTVAKNGNITVAKGLKKGRVYTLKVKVISASADQYEVCTKKVTIKIKISK